MELKEITSVGGIGKIFGEKLKMQRFHYAYQLHDQFLLLKKDDDAFVAWRNFQWTFVFKEPTACTYTDTALKNSNRSIHNYNHCYL